MQRKVGLLIRQRCAVRLANLLGSRSHGVLENIARRFAEDGVVQPDSSLSANETDFGVESRECIQNCATTQ
jgi:hypothetical protein